MTENTFAKIEHANQNPFRHPATSYPVFRRDDLHPCPWGKMKVTSDISWERQRLAGKFLCCAREKLAGETPALPGHKLVELSSLMPYSQMMCDGGTPSLSVMSW